METVIWPIILFLALKWSVSWRSRHLWGTFGLRLSDAACTLCLIVFLHFACEGEACDLNQLFLCQVSNVIFAYFLNWAWAVSSDFWWVSEEIFPASKGPVWYLFLLVLWKQVVEGDLTSLREIFSSGFELFFDCELPWRFHEVGLRLFLLSKNIFLSLVIFLN